MKYLKENANKKDKRGKTELSTKKKGHIKKDKKNNDVTKVFSFS